MPKAYEEFIDGLYALVTNNFIPMTRINDAVERILRVKFVMGLFEDPLADLSMAKYLGSKVRQLSKFYKPQYFLLTTSTWIRQ